MARNNFHTSNNPRDKKHTIHHTPYKSGNDDVYEDLFENIPNTQPKRSKYVNTVKKEMKFFNYGLPPNPKYIDICWEDVRREFIALKELWVRLNVYEANGCTQKGTIQYPEANRIIEYNLDGESVHNSYIRFKSLRNI